MSGEELAILQNIQTALQAIDGSTGYYNDIDADDIHLGWRDIEKAGVYPSIWVSNYRSPQSIQTEQINFDVNFSVEVLGYIKNNAGEEEVLSDCAKLASDMGKAIYADESIGSSEVWNLQIGTELYAYNPFGIVLLRISGTYSYNC